MSNAQLCVCPCVCSWSCLRCFCIPVGKFIFEQSYTHSFCNGFACIIEVFFVYFTHITTLWRIFPYMALLLEYLMWCIWHATDPSLCGICTLPDAFFFKVSISTFFKTESLSAWRSSNHPFFFFFCSFSLIGKRPWENASKDGREMLCVKSEPDWNSQHHKYIGTVCALSATLCSHHSKTFSLWFVLVSHFLWTRRFLWDISHKVCVLRRSFLHCRNSDTDRQLS